MSTSCAGVDCYPHGLQSLSASHNPGGTMGATLRRLGGFALVPPPGPSKFVQPETALYDLDGAPQVCVSCIGFVSRWRSRTLMMHQ